MRKAFSFITVLLLLTFLVYMHGAGPVWGHTNKVQVKPVVPVHNP